MQSIIAITGLAGHALGSWKSPGGYNVWLRDFLPDDLPECRILTYGYVSAVQHNIDQYNIKMYADEFLDAIHTFRNAEVCTIPSRCDVRRPTEEHRQDTDL